MSHKTEIKTELNNKEYLKKALDKLGFKYTESKNGEVVQTQGRYGVHEEVDIRIDGTQSKNLSGAVGFKENTDGTYTAVGDFYGLTNDQGERLTEQKLKGVVTGYSKDAEINESMMNLGFTLEDDDWKVEDGKIKVNYKRYV